MLRKLLGKSARELVNRASRLLQPPMTESTELADYLPHTNEVSQDFSVTTIRRNSFESTGMKASLFLFRTPGGWMER